jgi:streptomycin 6-kinase
MVTIPPQLDENIRSWHGQEGSDWLEALPAVVAALAARWGLTVGEPFGDDGAVSWVAPATTRGGSQAVLKVFLPGLENQHEAEALRHYGGRGAVRLLENEPGALLLERLRPGTSLWQLHDDDEAARIVAGLLGQLWHTPGDGHPFRTLAGDAMRWSDEIPAAWSALGRPFERELAALGGTLAAELAQSQGEQVVLHQDLHGGNVLRAERSPWLAIDPKPLVGEREFDLASLIRDTRERIDERLVRRRLDLLSELLELDRERMRRWAIVHALAWSIEGDQADAGMINCARWLSRM